MFRGRMYQTLKIKIKNMKEIMKILLNPKTIIWIVVMSVLPVGIAMKWKEVRKAWNKNTPIQKQTTLDQWVE